MQTFYGDIVHVETRAYAEEKLPKISTGWVGCTNVTDDRRTGDSIANVKEREREFTFAKKGMLW